MSVLADARRLAAPVGRPLRRALVGLRTRSWPPHSRLFVEQESAKWVLSYEARQLERTARALGVEIGPPKWASGVGGQSVFHLSQFTLLLQDFERHGNRLGVAYFHGRPGTPGMPEFDRCFDALRRRHAEIDRVQVTNRAMEELVLETGIAREKLHRIPIGIDLAAFPAGGATAQTAARAEIGLPETAFVVGSFQKDGVGWGDGVEPKLIKGPDVLVAALERLHELAPELFVLLTGPARGYVRRELDRLGIPYRHLVAGSRAELARAYHALDVYLVTSRQEGGPKAVLESMATGVPLVTTRVGQAPDLVEHGRNGLLVDVEEVEAIVDWTGRVREDGSFVDGLRRGGRETAEAHAYERLDGLWAELLGGFVEKDSA